MKELPTLAVLAVVGLGLAIGAVAKLVFAVPGWRAGGLVIGAGLLLAGGLRLTLRERQAGFLVVRSRGFDAAVLLGLGFAVVALANTIPAAGG